MSVRAGMASREIAVPHGVRLAGFAVRDEPASGVHDPVTLTALALDDTVVISADICILHEQTSSEIRRRLRGRGVGFGICVISCTHTHAAPSVAFGRVGSHDERAHASLVEACVEAAQHAWAARVPCDVWAGEARGLGIAVDRRRAGRAVDVPVQLLRLVRTDDSGRGSRVLGQLVCFACHPVILDGTNTLVSADFPGRTRELVESALPGSSTLWWSGCAGNLNPAQAGSPAADLTGTSSEHRTFAEVDRTGRVLAEAVLGCEVRPVSTSSVTAATLEVELPLDQLANAGTGAPRRRGWGASVC